MGNTYRMVSISRKLLKLKIKLKFHEKFQHLGKVEAILKTSPMVENICLYADPNYTFAVAVGKIFFYFFQNPNSQFIFFYTM